MEQNQNDNTSYVAMVTHSDATFTVDIIVLRSKMAPEMTMNWSYQI